MMPIEEFKARMDAMIREIKSAPKAKGSERIYPPGEMEWNRQSQALVQGMQLPKHAITSLTGLAEDEGLNFEEVLK
jgi:ureidoglycolate dehydrogenase (NAD+)